MAAEKIAGSSGAPGSFSLPWLVGVPGEASSETPWLSSPTANRGAGLNNIEGAFYCSLSVCLSLSPSLAHSHAHCSSCPLHPPCFCCSICMTRMPSWLWVGHWAQRRNFLSPQCRALAPRRAHSVESMCLGSNSLKAKPEVGFPGRGLTGESSQERP